MTSFSNLSPGDENFLVMSVPDLMNLIHRFLSLYEEKYGNNSKNKNCWLINKLATHFIQKLQLHY